jgi:hypothetical protein
VGPGDDVEPASEEPGPSPLQQTPQAKAVYFSQPRRRKYHMGTTALAAISTMAIG